MLDDNGSRVHLVPDPVGVYFKNMHRGSIGVIHQTLRECLPNWALLGISFVSASVMEVVTDRSLNQRLFATLVMIGVKELQNYDIFGEAMMKNNQNTANTKRKKQNMEPVIRRMNANLKYCGSRYEKRGTRLKSTQLPANSQK